MKPFSPRRRLLRVGMVMLAMAVSASACGLSSSARSSIKAASAGSAATVGGTAGAAGTAAQPGSAADTSGSGAVADPGAAVGAPVAGVPGVATDSGGAPVTSGGGAPVPVGGVPVAGGAPVAVGGSRPGGTQPGTAATTATKPGTTAATKPGTSPTKSGTTAAKPGTTAAKPGGGTTGGGTAAGTTNSASCSTANGNATGITATDINIGLHAPLTGTGTPFPVNSFDEGSKIFWRDPAHKVCGRTVNLEFQDDTYTPDGANRVCTAFAANKFLVLGGAGTDQIQACATNSDMTRGGVPYLSAGVTENGLTSLSNYFAASLTYRQQGNLLVTAARQNNFLNVAPNTVDNADTGGGKAQWAIIAGKPDNFGDAVTGITTALNAAGIKYHVIRVTNTGNYQAEATSNGQSLALAGYKVVYDLTAPGYWVFLTSAFYTQSPTGNGVFWTGPGVSFTDFLLAQDTCGGSKNAINGQAYYLAPNTGLDRATADFKAGAAADKQPGDDIQWGLWGLNQAVFNALNTAAQTGLTRQNFIAALQRSAFPVNPSYTPLAFNGSHFGGTGAYVQRINCGKAEPGQNQNGTWDTVGGDYLHAQ